jgi:hypothetical protein
MSRTFNTVIRAISIALLISLFVLVPAVFAWQVYPAFGHATPYGGEADSGNLGGQIEYPSGWRLARASGEHVNWNSSEVSWITSNRNMTDQPAMVFHIFQLGVDDCGTFRSENTGSGYNWSNLPDYYIWGKSTCGSGMNNELRFIINGTIIAGTEYYYQSVFYDYAYPGTSSTGRVTADSYWDRNILGIHYKIYNDYHIKFCIDSGTGVYNC